jgi:hypothetical protein
LTEYKSYVILYLQIKKGLEKMQITEKTIKTITCSLDCDENVAFKMVEDALYKLYVSMDSDSFMVNLGNGDVITEEDVRTAYNVVSLLKNSFTVQWEIKK